MTTEENIYAEVKNTFKSYDEAGLIDPISLRTWLRSEIKRFGNNLMYDTDDIIEVINGKATLPKDFWSLKQVWKYELSHYCAEDDSPKVLRAAGKEDLIHSECDCSKDGQYLKEDLYYKEKEIKIFYSSPQILRIAKGFNRNAVDKDCINLPNRVQKRNKNNVRLLNNILQTEFSNGYVYIIYKALPMDEDGNILIPETQHDRLRIYLEYHLKKKLVEEWVLNNDDPNLSNKLQYLIREESDAFELAMSELKADVMNPRVWKSIRNRQRRRHRRFENLMPKLTFRGNAY